MAALTRGDVTDSGTTLLKRIVPLFRRIQWYYAEEEHEDVLRAALCWRTLNFLFFPAIRIGTELRGEAELQIFCTQEAREILDDHELRELIRAAVAADERWVIMEWFMPWEMARQRILAEGISNFEHCVDPVLRDLDRALGIDCNGIRPDPFFARDVIGRAHAAHHAPENATALVSELHQTLEPVLLASPSLQAFVERETRHRDHVISRKTRGGERVDRRVVEGAVLGAVRSARLGQPLATYHLHKDHPEVRSKRGRRSRAVLYDNKIRDAIDPVYLKKARHGRNRTWIPRDCPQQEKTGQARLDNETRGDLTRDAVYLRDIWEGLRRLVRFVRRIRNEARRRAARAALKRLLADALGTGRPPTYRELARRFSASRSAVQRWRGILGERLWKRLAA